MVRESNGAKWKGGREAAACVVLAFLLWGCAAPGDGPPQAQVQPEPAPGAEGAVKVGSAGPLAGTEWRLVEIQSMDDAVGTTRPDDPALYTMSLRGDGTVSMVLNCNRAHGTWSAEAAEGGEGGRFQFGPLAGTRALCPPPSLDELIVSGAQYVRSYILRDGRLYLSLMADGGIHVWEPNPVSGTSALERDSELEAAILKASPSYTKEVIDQQGGTGRGRYAIDRVDLDGDGREEVFVYLMGSIFCGTGGCDLLLFSPVASGYRLVAKFPASQVPVIVSPSKNGAWSDLWRLESGGGMAASYVSHRYDGKRYVERDRIPASPAPQGQPVLGGEVSFERGIPLEPGA